MLARIEEHRQIRLEARAAHQSGLPSDSPRAREIADRLVASTAEFTREHDSTEPRRRTAAPDHVSAADPRGVHTLSRFTRVLSRYGLLVATINGKQRTDPASVTATREWIAAALKGSHDKPTTGH
jgi:hypothetical protein